jgi:hypothetical protein
MSNKPKTEDVQDAQIVNVAPETQETSNVPAIPSTEEPTNVTPAIVQDDYLMLMAQAVERSEKLEKMTPVMTLTAEYIELQKPGESFKGIYVGTQKMTVTNKTTGEVKELDAARFIINKRIWINAGAVLISELNRANIPAGTPLQVSYERKEGNTKIYSITLLG